MKPYEIRFTREAVKDVRKLSPKLRRRLREILVEVIRKDPSSGKNLVGDLKGFRSVRLTHRDRIVYTVNEKERRVYVHRARTHYGD